VHTDVYTDVSTALRSGHAYLELKQRLLAGDFRLGARLKEAQLAGLLGVSRTPIREALLRLHAEGLVRRRSDGGFEPLVPDVSAIRWLYEVRASLELQAIQRPARVGGRHDTDALAELVDEWEAMASDVPEPATAFVVVDEAFHIALADAAGNPVLVELLRQVNDRIRGVRMLDFLTADRIESTIAEHVAIARAVLHGDVVTAENRFLTHIEFSQSVVEERVAAAIARMATAPDMGDRP
jgi:DNA-binding GntR family transcriptional regulator